MSENNKSTIYVVVCYTCSRRWLKEWCWPWGTYGAERPFSPRDPQKQCRSEAPPVRPSGGRHVFHINFNARDALFLSPPWYKCGSRNTLYIRFSIIFLNVSNISSHPVYIKNAYVHQNLHNTDTTGKLCQAIYRLKPPLLWSNTPHPIMQWNEMHKKKK